MLYLSSFPTVYTKVLSSGLCEAEACGIKETVQTHKSYQVSLIWPFSLSLYSVLIFAYFLYLRIRPVKLQEQLLTMQALIKHTSNAQINWSPSSAVQYANMISAKLWPFKEQGWTCNATHTCRQCSGSRWHDRQRSRSCLLPALHQLYEWSFEMQPQFELHLHNTANGTEFRIKHNSEQHAPLFAFADGLHLLTISSLGRSTLEAQLTHRFLSYFTGSVHLLRRRKLCNYLRFMMKSISSDTMSYSFCQLKYIQKYKNENKQKVSKKLPQLLVSSERLEGLVL